MKEGVVGPWRCRIAIVRTNDLMVRGKKGDWQREGRQG